MAHNFTSGVFVKERAWHGLGTVIPETLPIREMFKLAGADFTANKENILLESTGAKIEGFKAITNETTGEVLSIQTDEYHVIPNDRLIELGEALREECDPISVAVMGGGRRVAFTATIRGLNKDVLKGDGLEMKISGINSFDSSQAFTVLFDPTRIVCDNTLGYAIGGADRAASAGRNSIIRVTHRSNADAIIRQIPNIINVAEARFTASIEEAVAMAAKPCDVELFKRILELTYADELKKPINDVRGDESTKRMRKLTDINGFDVICNNFAGDLIGGDIPGVAGTVWSAFNSITQFYRHDLYANGRNTEARRYGSLHFGVTQQRIQRAHAAALTATKA